MEKCEIAEILEKWDTRDNHFCLCSIRKFCENSECPYHSEKPDKKIVEKNKMAWMKRF